MGIVTVTFNDSTHRLVPVWPTPEMMHAACEAVDNITQEQYLMDQYGAWTEAETAYHAMLAAAPAVQPQQPLGDAASGPGSLSLRSDDPYRSTPTSEASRDL